MSVLLCFYVLLLIFYRHYVFVFENFVHYLLSCMLLLVIVCVL